MQRRLSAASPEGVPRLPDLLLGRLLLALGRAALELGAETGWRIRELQDVVDGSLQGDRTVPMVILEEALAFLESASGSAHATLLAELQQRIADGPAPAPPR